MAWSIPLSDLSLGDEERAAVDGVLRSQWLTMGAVTQQFEQAFATQMGVRFAAGVTNGTAALHLACMALGLGPGDEVILPSLTFVASANAVRYTGAQPVFADIFGENDLNLSPGAVEAAITPRTRAIMVVHYGGYACDMPAMMELAARHGLNVIEDAAHAVGASLAGRSLGCWGDVGCFSFFSNKNLTTGEGGMVVTNDEALFRKITLLRSHGMTSLTWDRHQGHAWSYDVTALGYNYRIDEIRAALGLVQLERLEQNNALRRRLTALYRDLLGAIPDLGLPFVHHPGLTSAHLLPVLLPPGADRRAFMESMREHGVQTSIHYPPVHSFSAYREERVARGVPPPSLPITEAVAAREVTLPLYASLSETQVELVAQAVQAALERVAHLE